MRPGEALPRIFRGIDSAMKRFLFDNPNLGALGIPGKVRAVEYEVRSKASRVTLNGGSVDVIVSGFADLVLDMDAGGLGLFELKTTGIKSAEKALEDYADQLEAYVYAIEETAPEWHSWRGEYNKRSPEKVTAAGILAFSPDAFRIIGAGEEEREAEAELSGRIFTKLYPLEYMPPVPEKKFIEIGEFVLGPLPAASKTCPYCRFAGEMFKLSRRYGGINTDDRS